MTWPPTGLRSTLQRYIVAGGLAALVDLGVFVLLIELGLALALAAVTSFLTAMAVNFLISARFVFGTAPTLRRLRAFAFFATMGLLLNSGITLAVAGAGVPAWLAKCSGIGGAFLFNYTVNALIVFRR